VVRCAAPLLDVESPRELVSVLVLGVAVTTAVVTTMCLNPEREMRFLQLGPKEPSVLCCVVLLL